MYSALQIPVGLIHILLPYMYISTIKKYDHPNRPDRADPPPPFPSMEKQIPF